MEKINIDFKAVRFDEGKEDLEKKGYRIISLEEKARARIEAGKISRRLSWLLMIVCLFFVYLSVSFSDQPSHFKLSFLGNILIDKKILVLLE